MESGIDIHVAMLPRTLDTWSRLLLNADQHSPLVMSISIDIKKVMSSAMLMHKSQPIAMCDAALHMGLWACLSFPYAMYCVLCTVVVCPRSRVALTCYNWKTLSLHHVPIVGDHGELGKLQQLVSAESSTA
jgi:hypothetical protein